MDDALLWLLLQQQLKLPPLRLRLLMRLAASPRQLLELDDTQVQQFLYCRLGDEARAQQLLDDSLRAQIADVLCDRHAGQQLGEQLLASDCQLLSLADSDYPQRLAEIADPPPLLYLRGRRELLGSSMLAVVGSRRPSRRGEEDAYAFAQALSARGFSIVSGMAMGIDGAAHAGALGAVASSVAVLGCGVDICYPRRHQALYQQLGEQGLLISEYALGSPPLPHQFPRRNRIISGLCVGVLVVEAATNSGSLITARQALEQNREVFALPGSIHNPASRGCNALIRQGAKLVETLDDIFEELPPLAAPPAGAVPAAADDELAEPPLLALLEFAPLNLEQLAQRSALPVAALLSALSELEVAGWVEQCRGGWQRCR